MDFNNVRLLGYTHDNQFFGELFNFQSKKNLSIEGSLLDLTNSSGVSSGIWNSGNALIGTDYTQININGVSFGSGRLVSLNFLPSQDLNEKIYNASVEIINTGNLYNFTGYFYQNIDSSNYSLIDNISEEFSFNQNSQGDKNFVHSVNLRVFSGSGDALALAKRIASGLKEASNITGLFSGYLNANRKKYYQESINKITNEYGFTETYNSLQETGNYSIQFSHSLTLNEDGFIEVSENGNIVGTTNWPATISGLNTELSKSFTRCSEVYSGYSPTTHLLNPKLLSLNKQLNEFENTATYSASFTNNLALRTGFSWIYTHEISESDGIAVVNEQGEILGWGRLPSEKFLAARNAFDSIKNGVYGRIVNLYPVTNNFLRTFRQMNSEVSFSELAGKVNYNYQYTNDDKYVLDPFIKKAEVSITDNYPRQFFNNFEVVNVAEITQRRNSMTLGERSLTLNLFGNRNASLTNYLNYAKNRINQYIPSGNDTFINSTSYSFNSGEKNLNLNLSWNYVYSGEDLIYTILPRQRPVVELS